MKLLVSFICTLFLLGCGGGETPIPSPPQTQPTVVTAKEAAKIVSALPTELPDNARTYIPILLSEIRQWWSTLTQPSYLAAQIEQETCPSLKSKMCWSPTAELKTSRENGIGLGQITIAYNSDGTERFNNFKEAQKLDTSLRDWKWEDRYDANKQLRALVLTDYSIFMKIVWTTNAYERLAFTFAAYNGGLGSVNNDRELCKSTKGCEPSIWFDNVEKTSWKSQIKVQGYGQSFFDINRGYVKNVMTVRNEKYKSIDR